MASTAQSNGKNIHFASIDFNDDVGLVGITNSISIPSQISNKKFLQKLSIAFQEHKANSM